MLSFPRKTPSRHLAEPSPSDPPQTWGGEAYRASGAILVIALYLVRSTPRTNLRQSDFLSHTDKFGLQFLVFPIVITGFNQRPCRRDSETVFDVPSPLLCNFLPKFIERIVLTAPEKIKPPRIVNPLMRTDNLLLLH